MLSKNQNSNFKTHVRLSRPAHLLAVGFGSGMSPFMPGTIGSLVAIPIWYFCFSLSPLWYWILILAFFILGCFICDIVSKDTKSHDSSHIVWDEFVGMWITLFFIPSVSFLWIGLAFVLFRIFDIAKPWPIGFLDRKISGGFGIMIDDVMAAIFASLSLYVLSFWL